MMRGGVQNWWTRVKVFTRNKEKQSTDQWFIYSSRMNHILLTFLRKDRWSESSCMGRSSRPPPRRWGLIWEAGIWTSPADAIRRGRSYGWTDHCPRDHPCTVRWQGSPLPIPYPEIEKVFAIFWFVSAFAFGKEDGHQCGLMCWYPID